MKKIFLSTLIILCFSSAWGRPPEIIPGIYGNNSQFCGFKLFMSPKKGNILVEFINNPGRKNTYCTDSGLVDNWFYDKVNEAYRVNRDQTYCLLTNQINYSVQMTCYFTRSNEIESVDVYNLY